VAQRFPPLAKAPINETRACHYELSASRNFIIDKHPNLSNVWIAGGGSAEGFKFGPVLGEFIAKRVHGDAVDPVLAEAFKIPKVVETSTRRA
jgi:glycine/D-amino acid oxidase-like deaminating enzyme